MNLKKIIREIDDYPKKGIVFRDISTILSNPEAFSFTLDELGKFVKKMTSTFALDVILKYEIV